jgi:ankyrin repeat protein
MYPLHQAIQTGQLEVVKRLLSQPDIDPNTKNKEGDASLHIAITRTNLIVRPNDFYRTELFRYFQRIGNE